MLTCYYSQGKQLASGVIGLLTCQSHYNVSGINTTPCARLLLRHPLDQHMLTRTCAWSLHTRGTASGPPPVADLLLDLPFSFASDSLTSPNSGSEAILAC